ncbi:MAG: CotH kinase family protein [Clostridia bacterium]|nr:CotH kinase family protein [Clostridia bacterium]
MKRIWAAALLALVALFPSAASADMPEYARMTEAERESLGRTQGRVVLELEDGTPLPYDEVSNTYFIPQDAQTEAFCSGVSVRDDSNLLCSVVMPQGWTKKLALDVSMGFEVVAEGEDAVFASNVVLTPLPVLDIRNDSGELPGDQTQSARLALYAAEKDGGVSCEQTPIGMNLRGNTSKWLPKKSYRVKILDEQGKKRNLSIAGLREDDDWILNPMYSDTSKIREKLAYELWDAFNSCGTAARSSRLEYAEVLFDGQYWGLYGVQERIDRKQVDSHRRSGILYKVFANDRPTVEEVLACGDEERCGGLEIKHAGTFVENPWTPAASYMSLLFGEKNIAGAVMSLKNTIDYGLWAMLLQAHDCHFKNQFLHAVYENGGYTMYKIPWDLNHTFGDVWYGDGKEQNYTNYIVGRLVMDGSFEKLIETGGEEVYAMIRARWAQLRSGIAREDAIMARAREIHQPIYGAIVRDGRRWPECGMGEGNADNLRDIQTSIRMILPEIDVFVEELGRQPAQK